MTEGFIDCRSYAGFNSMFIMKYKSEYKLMDMSSNNTWSVVDCTDTTITLKTTHSGALYVACGIK